MIRARALAMLLAAALPWPTVAQEREDKVRLDDFALPQGAPAPVAQIAPPERSAAAPPSPSDPTDSRPQPTARLDGRDRCDPQSLPSRERARCRRILERRAAEFEAPEPPVLSAEQKILAAQHARERRHPLQPETGLLTAKTDPDPDDRSTQELAAIVLSDTPPPPSDRLGETEPPAEKAFGDILDALEGAPIPPN